jgi:hypothetical protein
MHLKAWVAQMIGGVVRAAPLALLLALGGCAALEEALNPPDPQAEATEQEAAPAAEPPLPPAPKPRPARIARLPAPVEKAPPAQASLTPPEPEPVPVPEASPLPDIKLVGMSRGEASALLGAPAEERDAAPAKIWKFSAGECAVDIYFYLDVKRNDFYALHYNVQDGNGATTGEAADRCLQRIYSENHR